jgi:sodium/bile acid cotransporter 7
LDPFTLILIAALALAFALPVQGGAYSAFFLLSKAVVALLFFLHGARLSPESVRRGFANYKPQLLILFSTFAFFPLAAALCAPLFGLFLPGELIVGFLFLAALPSTVQSSIAFTSIAKGNVAAAVCAASLSSLLGVVLTPLLAKLIIHADSASAGLSAVKDLCLQLVLPFLAGQLLRPRLSEFLERRKKITSVTDRLSVVFIVYVSFSHASNTGLWKSLSLGMLPGLIFASCLLLAAALLFTWKMGGLLRLPRPDRAAALFCGSKKSLMTGVPMANVIFPAAQAGLIIIPLMLFHQIQLIVCAFIAKSLSRREDGQEG